MVKIEKKIIKGAMFLLLLVVMTTAAFAVEYTSINELRSRGIIKDLTYAYGYDDGYDDQSSGKASTPNSIVNKFRRVSTEDPDYLGAELAYRYKGDYTSGYSSGYADAKNKKARAVDDDFLYTYGAIKAGTVLTGVGTTTWTRWNLGEIDTSHGIENLAYGIGYTDASTGNAKSPLKIMQDLAKEKRNEVREVYEWIRDNRGTFIKKYKEGYDAYKSGKVVNVGTTPSKTTQLQVTQHASQQYGAVQKSTAYESGYKIGYADAEAGKVSNPQTVLSYDWTLNARYTSTGESDNRNWYTLPEGVTQNDVENAKADKGSYLNGYKEGYTMALREDEPEDTEMTDAEYVYAIGFEVGQVDAQNGVASNPYTYTWKTHRYKTKTEELEYSKMIRYNRASYIKGYRDGFVSG